MLENVFGESCSVMGMLLVRHHAVIPVLPHTESLTCQRTGAGGECSGKVQMCLGVTKAFPEEVAFDLI